MFLFVCFSFVCFYQTIDSSNVHVHSKFQDHTSKEVLKWAYFEFILQNEMKQIFKGSRSYKILTFIMLFLYWSYDLL